MSKADKTFEKVMSGHTDASISYDDLCSLLERLGFISRQHGTSHRKFRHGTTFLNLQEGNGGKAKPYQVRQVREALQNLNLRP